MSSSRFRRIRAEPSWRRMARHAWGFPRDPSIYAFLDVDVTLAQPWIARARERHGAHVTITHLVGKAVALAIAERPEVNSIIRRGRGAWARDSVGVFFQIARDGGEDLLGARVERADEKSVLEIARELEHLAKQVRAHRGATLDRTTSLLKLLPDALIGPALRAVETLTYDLGIDASALGVPYDAFGSAMVTNIGTFGLRSALAPLVPFARTPIVITVGAVHDAATVIDKRVEVRPTLTLGVTLDHRVLDGFQAAALAERFRAVLEDPEQALGGP